MSITQHKYFKPTIFRVGVLMETFDYLFKTYQDPTSNVYFFDLQKFQEDGTLTSNKITAKDLRDICSFHGHVLSMVVINAKQSSVAVEITGKSDHTEIELRVDDPNTLRSVWDHLVTNLSLEETEEAPTSTSKALAAIIAMLENRLKVLEAAANRADHLRCFLSYRFTPASEAIALNIQRFLTLLDVEVTTGAAYEPRRISDKVLDKL